MAPALHYTLISFPLAVFTIDSGWQTVSSMHTMTYSDFNNDGRVDILSVGAFTGETAVAKVFIRDSSNSTHVKFTSAIDVSSWFSGNEALGQSAPCHVCHSYVLP
jgi:hypothetical protein